MVWQTELRAALVKDIRHAGLPLGRGDRPRVTLQEHIHIPSGRPGHEGYLAFVCDLHDENLSEAMVLEAGHIERGPVCRIKLPMRLRPQVHGTWVPQEDLPPA